MHWDALLATCGSGVLQGGKRQIVLGVDDQLLKSATRRIPRADVAELAVQCLTLPAAKNRWGTCPYIRLCSCVLK